MQVLASIMSLSVTKVFVVCTCLNLVFFFILLLYPTNAVLSLIDDWFCNLIFSFVSFSCLCHGSLWYLFRTFLTGSSIFFNVCMTTKDLYFWWIACVLYLMFSERFMDIDMYSLSVNQTYSQQLLLELDEKAHKFVSIGYYLLHIYYTFIYYTSNAFKNVLIEFKSGINL